RSRDRDLREFEGFAFGVEVGSREDARLRKLQGALVIRLGALEGGVRGVELSVDIRQLLRRRVGSDLEERLSGLDPISDLDEAAAHDAGDLLLDRELLP